MSTERAYLRWPSESVWITGTILGWTLFLVAPMQLVQLSVTDAYGRLWADVDFEPSLMTWILLNLSLGGAFMLFGAVTVGAVQSLVIRSYFGVKSRWSFWVTTSVVAIAWMIGSFLSAWPMSAFWHQYRLVAWLANGVTVGIAVGLAAGIGQWVLLRSRAANAKWWVVTTALAWTAGMATYWLVYAAAGGPLDGTSLTTYYSDGTSTQTDLTLNHFSAMLVAWFVGASVIGSILGLSLKALSSRTLRNELVVR